MAPPYLTDRELLLVIRAEVRDLKRAIEGNGQPGLLHRVTAVETKVAERDRIATKAGSMGGGIGAAIAAVVMAVMSRFGLGA